MTTALRTRGTGTIGRRPLWMLIPAALVLTLITLIPILLVVNLSFREVVVSTLSQWMSAPFIGLENYRHALFFDDLVTGTFFRSLGLTVAFAFITTLITAPLGVLVALSVNHRFPGRGVLRSLFLVPYVLPVFVTAIVMRLMFQNGTGLVGRILEFLGIGSRDTYWLLGPNSFWAFVIAAAWTAWPFIYIMTLAGLASLPAEVLDAAEVDGAGYWARIRYVILPHLRPVLLLALLLATIAHLGNFTLPYVMFESPPPEQVTVVAVSIYYQAFTNFQYGIASAIAVLMLLVMAIPGYLYLRATHLGEGDD